MSIQFPADRKTIDDRMKADVQTALPESNPFLKNSFLGALITGVAGREYEFYLQLKNALLEMFPDTADGAYLERWGSYVNINRNPASISSGYVDFTGVNGTIIPTATLLTAADAGTYTTDAVATIYPLSVQVTTATELGTTVTCNCALPHNLATGMTVTISGATPAAYNGNFPIVVVDADTFTYETTAGLASPATGTILATASFARVKCSSTLAGVVYNQIGGTQLTVAGSIPGLDSTAYVAFDELASGTDTESDISYRARVLYRYQNPVALFNEVAITIQAFKYAGVTRVWVVGAGVLEGGADINNITRSGYVKIVETYLPHNLEAGQMVSITGASPSAYNDTVKCLPLTSYTFAYTNGDNTSTTPATGVMTYSTGGAAGQVRVYFMKDNATDPIPNAVDIAAVQALVEAIRPAHVHPLDAIVSAPVPILRNFVFTALSPNTAAMQQAITQSLEAVFKEDTQVSTNLPSASYISAIWQTVDSTGAVVNSFTLSSTADVVVSNGGIATLGTVTYPS